ncbi:MAG: hypothetical protein ACI85X_000579 [Woeseiaceae bacterium]|jgi:hypothetical protein
MIYGSIMKNLTSLLILLCITSCNTNIQTEKQQNNADFFTLSKSVLKDKIKGAWVGQTVGVTYGYPVEFKFESRMVPDNHELPWYDGYLKETFTEIPGAYDDVYMDLTFVQVFEDYGLDAPASAFASAFANADYKLWFANQVSRYNILNGIEPPQSGHWLNNPAADDIDFQIEADFAGIMTPGMVNSATKISDRVGHIMNYGDGWYGGVYIAAMYSLAYVSDDIEYVVNESLKLIPEESNFHKIITDVITIHEEQPNDWKIGWQYIHDKWTDTDLGPWGVFDTFNIDAKINAAWVVLGLLYGEGDFTKTIDIATRAGDDADCNPASAAGILGTMQGFDAIPDFWKQGLEEIEGLPFAYTSISLNDAYELSYKHALAMISLNDGKIEDDSVTIKLQSPTEVPFEQSFKGHYAKDKREINDSDINTTNYFSFNFNGTGFALMGKALSMNDQEHTYTAEMFINGKLIETVKWPTNFTTRRFYLSWKYQLPKNDYTVEIRVKNPTNTAEVSLESIVIYDDQPLINNSEISSSRLMHD